jgi:hypothetical protein
VYVPIVLLAGTVLVVVIGYFVRVSFNVSGSALGNGTAPSVGASIAPVSSRAADEVAVPQTGGAPAEGGALPGNGVGGGGPAQGGPPAPIMRMVADLRARIARNPKDAQALAGLAGLYAESSQFDKAAPLYARAVAAAPQDAQAHADYAATLHALGNDAAAQAQIAAALASKPDFPPALFQQGAVAAAAGHRDAAIAAYRRFLAVAPNDPRADDARSALQSLGAS